MLYLRFVLTLNILLCSVPVFAMSPGEKEGLRNRKIHQQPIAPVIPVEEDRDPFSLLPAETIALIISHLDQDDWSVHFDVANLRETSKLFFTTIESLCQAKGWKYPKHILAPENDSPVPQNSSSSRLWVKTCGALAPLSYAYEFGCTWSGGACLILSPCAWYGMGMVYDVVSHVVNIWLIPKLRFADVDPFAKTKFADNKVFTSLDDERLLMDKNQKYLISGKAIKGIFEKYELIKSLDVSVNLTQADRYLILGERDEDMYSIAVRSLCDYTTIHDRALFEAYVSHTNTNGGEITFRWYPWNNLLDLKLSYEYEY